MNQTTMRAILTWGLVFTLLSCPGPFSGYAQADEAASETDSFSDKVIGKTFRSLARAFVAASDICNLQQSNLEKLKKMSDEKFRKRYAKIYEILRDLPEDTKSRYGITPDMTRAQAIENLKSLDKRQTYKLIDAVPNSLIANAFRKNFRDGNREETEKEAIVARVKKAWASMMQRVWNTSKPDEQKKK